ncbi:MAG: hypothetical protein CMP76_16325 [Flavobacterium sp.]|uniref:hypothetical protein n=1 Tax=Flavobacterium sp. TaxID=239 RepID=UPI000C68139C|nr:hypothetical protein [Flavobacterium sp.]MBF04849.1 hypothetical protein [Flavobacterium sp.]|tara:strand:+ start:2264 stop:3172 length:909 start_codon:yes stop_codon:yes gene_type:complete
MTLGEKATAIDNLIGKQYLSGIYGELAALSKLFKDEFLRGLEKILNINSRNEPNYKESFEVSCGWIDKIPLAKFTGTVTDINGNYIRGKMELGDLLIIYTSNNSFKTKDGIKTDSLANRAIIVQAKIANKAFPNVPIGSIRSGRANSTSKELALLSKWPEFDLYQTSKSTIPLLQNLNLDNSKPNAKFAGFFSRKWYIGKPSYGETCTDSLGDLITGLIKGIEGEDFDIGKTGDWNSLIKELVEVCGKYQLPNFIFGKSAGSRFKSMKRTPLILFIFFGFDIFSPRRFPILVINKVTFEGKF